MALLFFGAVAAIVVTVFIMKLGYGGGRAEKNLIWLDHGRC
jgi:hypothetical protein